MPGCSTAPSTSIMSALTGEWLPVGRYSSAQDSHVPLLHARELLFTGTTCVAGTATGVVYAIGAHCSHSSSGGSMSCAGSSGGVTRHDRVFLGVAVAALILVPARLAARQRSRSWPG